MMLTCVACGRGEEEGARWQYAKDGVTRNSKFCRECAAAIKREQRSGNPHARHHARWRARASTCIQRARALVTIDAWAALRLRDQAEDWLALVSLPIDEVSQ